jgi:hypothetical protein
MKTFFPEASHKCGVGTHSPYSKKLYKWRCTLEPLKINMQALRLMLDRSFIMFCTSFATLFRNKEGLLVNQAKIVVILDMVDLEHIYPYTNFR